MTRPTTGLYSVLLFSENLKLWEKLWGTLKANSSIIFTSDMLHTMTTPHLSVTGNFTWIKRDYFQAAQWYRQSCVTVTEQQSSTYRRAQVQPTMQAAAAAGKNEAYSL